MPPIHARPYRRKIRLSCGKTELFHSIHSFIHRGIFPDFRRKIAKAVYIIYCPKFRQIPLFSDSSAFYNANFSGEKLGLDSRFLCCGSFAPPLFEKNQKNFEIGIDFMVKPRYNAYLYEH
jgi:hypothetical protein